MKKVIFILVFSLLSIQIALSYDIKGVMIDNQTGETLRDVNVLIDGTTIGTNTDENGKFQLKDVPVETFILSAGHIGYKIFKIKINPLWQNNIRIALEPVFLSGEDVIVTATRADMEKAAASFSNITVDQIGEAYSVQEFPILLESSPGVYSYAEAGNPQGYSYLKIRGFDPRRIAVMINGIPHNDPLDHAVYWVNMPDFAANVNDIQIQRGLGYSPYGPSSFGGSINIMTNPDPQNRRLETSYGYGDFNTRKFSALFNSGIVDNSYQFFGRFSRITTDGFRDNAGYEGWSYYLSASRYGLDNTLTLNVYGVPQLTHVAWYAIPEEILAYDRKYNPIEYKNTIDNFNQPHYEMHHNLRLSEKLTLMNTLYYIRGKGYWEVFKGYGEPLYAYGLSDNPSAVSNLVQQYWTEKNQWGFIPTLMYDGKKWEWNFGANLYTFDSHQYGKIIWIQDPPEGVSIEPEHKDHDYNYDIWETAGFGHVVYKGIAKWNFIADLQYRHIDVDFRQNPAGAFQGAELNRYHLTRDFLNPRLGASYKLFDSATAYITAGYAQREPSPNEYWDPWAGPYAYGMDPFFNNSEIMTIGDDTLYTKWTAPAVEPEELFNYEIGIRCRTKSFKGAVNLYLMDFRNEVVPAWGMNLGYQVTINVDKALHRGIEAEAVWKPFSGLADIIYLRGLELFGSGSYSLNTFESDFVTDTLTAEIKGNKIPLFPELILNGGLSYSIRSNSGWTVRPWLKLRYIGEQYLEAANIEEAVIDPYGTVDAGLIIQTPKYGELPQLRFKVNVNNILDDKHETSGYYYEGSYYYPGAPRNYYAELTVGL